jgi:hypothetical protein
MNQKRLAEFDALIGSYYGGSGTSDVQTDPRKRVQDLLSTYYGNPGAATKARAQPSSVSLSLGCDDGEILSQPVQSSKKCASMRNGTQTAQSVSLDFEEYVIDVCEAEPPAASDTYNGPTPAQQPTGQASPAPTRAPVAPPAAPQPTPTTQAAPVAPVAPGSVAQSLSAAEADIVNDIQSIIRGQKVYEKERGMVDRSTASSTNAGGSERTAPYAGVSSQPKDGHAIFDRIAQSMQYANAYDLGTVPLENRFAEFDRQEDQRRAAKKQNGTPKSAAAPARPVSQPAPPAPDPAQPTTADFVADLDTITSQTMTPAYSRPFYDTGEHVLAGNGQYADMLRVGKGQSVRLSYGQIISMGDLYDTADDLLNADPAELNRLKTLIVRNTTFYEGKKSSASQDVSNEEWDDATKGRYLKLAEANYEHFSPPTVAMGSGLKTKHGNNRSQWEHYHRLAIEDAQQEYLAQPSGVDIFFERALIINAFGDHFLTDAFAAGHLLNKDVMIDRFRSAFLKGKDLTSAGSKFFERVADAAWKGDVAAKFSKLEGVEFPTVHAPWWVGLIPGGLPIAGRDVPVPFHPNIDSADRFATVLKGAAKQQPERVGNLMLKALHDHLNTNGIEVTNGAGDGTWMLPGDGSLTVGTGNLTPANLAKNLEIMRKAVQQSIDDINDPSIRANNLNFQKYFDGVWRYVPKLTSASQKQMTALIRDFTDPNSSTLVQAAAEIVTAQLNSFIKLLIDEHKLQPA